MDSDKLDYFKFLATRLEEVYLHPKKSVSQDEREEDYARNTLKAIMHWPAEWLDTYARAGEDLLTRSRWTNKKAHQLYRDRLFAFSFAADEKFANEHGYTLVTQVESDI